MRKIFVVLGVVVAIALPAAALATTMDTSKFGNYITNGAKCKETTQGAWYHFVLNKIDDSVDKSGIGFKATFTNETVNLSTPTFYNNGTAHYWLFSSSFLTKAETTGTDPGSRATIQLSSSCVRQDKNGPPA